MSKYLLPTLLFLILLFGFGASVSAQDADTPTTYVSSNGSFSFQLPAGWGVHERNEGTLTSGQAGGPYSIWLVPPARLVYFNADTGKTAADVLTAFMAATDSTFDYGSPHKVILPSGKVGVRVAFKSPNEALAAATALFVLVFPVDETFVIIQATAAGGDEAELEAIVFQIADSFTVTDFVLSGRVTGDLPDLRDLGTGMSGDDWSAAIADLRDLDLVSAGGAAVYGEDWIMLPGLYVDPATESAYSDYVMAGVISLQLLDENEPALCGLITRATFDADDHLNTFVIVGATERNTLVVMDKYNPDEQFFFYETGVLDANFYNPEHLLYIVQGNKLTAFVDGHAVIEALVLPEPPAVPAVQSGTILQNGCVMSGVWAYGLPSSQDRP